MEKILIDNLSQLFEKECIWRKLISLNHKKIYENILDCRCCSSFKNDIEKLMEIQISKLLKDFSNIQLIIDGMELAYEPYDNIREQYHKLYKITAALNPVSKKVRTNFPHFNKSFDSVIKLYDKKDN